MKPIVKMASRVISKDRLEKINTTNAAAKATAMDPKAEDKIDPGGDNHIRMSAHIFLGARHGEKVARNPHHLCHTTKSPATKQIPGANENTC
jgi:hypothetical protein